MKNGEKILTKENRIANRIYILSNIESIIKESVYYRNYSIDFVEKNKTATASILLNESKAKLI